MASTKCKSVAWSLFKIDESDSLKAVCLICQIKISRGSKPTNLTTTNMLKHLSIKHADELKEQEEKEKKRKEEEEKKKRHLPFNTVTKRMKVDSNKDQPTLLETIEKKKIWDINDSRAKKYHKLIAEMIAVDLQPFSIVDDTGFTRLVNAMCPNYNIPSRKYIKENIIGDMYSQVKNKIQTEIDQANFISFTSDGWTATTSNISFLSLTGHWISDTYEQKTAIIRVVPFPSSHTAANISKCLQDTINEFNIPNNKIHVIVRDNAANMAAGVTQAGYKSLPCFMHTLQLVLNDAIFEQNYVKNIVTVGKQIVGHFNHSPAAFSRYEEYQKTFNLPKHKFIQDVSTRWNSQYYMLSRILEQKNALIGYCSDHAKPSCLDTNQWQILEKLCKILKNFVDCTNLLSAREALASSIIPNMKVICKFFEKGEEKGLFGGLGSTLSAWKVSVSNRFNPYFNDKNLIIATYLDPRYKANFLKREYNNLKMQDNLKQWMLDDIIELNKESEITTVTQTMETSENSADEKSDTSDDTDFNFSFTECIAEFNEEKKKKKLASEDRNNAASEVNKTIDNSIKAEMAKYEGRKRISQSDNPLQWWKNNKDTLPNMALLTKKYLCAPPSSVESERLFSVGGSLYSPKRNRMTADTGEMLMFLHYNLLVMGFNYNL